MVYFIAKIISGIFGIDISKVQRWVAVGLVVIALALIAVLGFWIKGCVSRRSARLDEKQIIKNQQAIESHDREEMKQALAESQVAVDTIDQNLANSKAEQINAIHEAKVKAEQMTNDEIAAELERLSKEQ